MMIVQLSAMKFAICVAMLAAFGMAVAAPATDNFPYLMGESTGRALIIYVFLELFSLRKIVGGAIKARIFSFGLLISIGVLGGYANSAYEDYQFERMKAGMAAAMGDYRAGKKVSPESFAAGDFGKLEQIVRLSLKTRSDLLLTYQAEIQKTGISNILSPEQLNIDRDLRKAKRAIALSMPIVEKFSFDAIRQGDLMREKIESIQVNDYDRDQMLAGFDAGYQSNGADSERWWHLERNSMTKISDIVRFLERTNSKWTVQGGIIYFTEDRKLKEYNGMLLELQRIQDEQSKINNFQAQKFKRKMNDLLN